MDKLVSRDGRTTALRNGRGPDFLVVHSLLTDRDSFRDVVPELAARCRVTLLNLPGFHGSAPIHGTVADYGNWLADACNDFDIGPDCIVCGNGFGGTIALAFALKYQNRIGKLILADVAAAFPAQGKAAFRTMADAVEQKGMASIAPIAAARIYHSAYLAEKPEAIEERRRVLISIQTSAFVAACRTLIDCDLVPQLSRLHIPTLVVYGALDQATPPELNKIIAAEVPNSKIKEIVECGHCPPLEKPQDFLQAIYPFILA